MIVKSVKPFLKWAGGKTQLISEIEKSLPELTIDTYIEPFVGSGAVLFWVLGAFTQLGKAVVNDINEDLINTYKTIQSAPKELISVLEILQKEYHSLENSDDNAKDEFDDKLLMCA
ncbi:MAG: DNA adenine methylase [Bacteroidales bacterium]|nr:DNA adenine methylase [Bacteroidales bacterium]